MTRNKLSLFLMFAVFWVITATGVACAGAEAGSAKPQDNNAYSHLASIADRYIVALQSGNAAELKRIFLPEASYYFFREGQLVGGKVDILYKAVENSPIPKPIVYDVTSVQMSGRIASITLDIRNLMGVHIIDMFTLVQDDDNAWKIASKVARRQN